MKIILDTNVLLVSISERSKEHWIFEYFLNEEYELYVTTEILAEYEEILSQHLGEIIAQNVMNVLENAPNVIFITRYYHWDLIKKDPDDNKFVDCAIASNAKFIVTEDKHFNILKTIPFPKIDVINIKTFGEIIKH